MKVNDIVYLKSGSPKLQITWINGGTDNPIYPFDVDSMLKMRPDHQTGEVSIKWIDKKKDAKGTFPKDAIIDDLQNRIPSKDSPLQIGNVVTSILSDTDMTIIWVIGNDTQASSIIDYNRLLIQRGYREGDIVCGWFDKTSYTSKIFRKEEVLKKYD